MSKRADTDRLRDHVQKLEGERHPLSSPDALAKAEAHVFDTLGALGLEVERQPFELRGRRYHNVVARKPGLDLHRPRVLVGAHFDTVPCTLGADDNASGVAVLLEAARILTRYDFRSTVEFVGFNLEEPQGFTYRVGSRRFAAQAWRDGVEYSGCLVLEMVGYTDPTPGSQSVPALLFWKRVPDAGTFLAAIGDLRSRRLLSAFERCAAKAEPALRVVTFRTPLRGRLVFHTRLSDNASFWDRGYPSLMITDTAFLRNPHYHRPSDRASTLDLDFMGKVANATVETVRHLAGDRPGINNR